MAASAVPRGKHRMSVAVAAFGLPALLISAVPHALAVEAKLLAYGQHMARECTSCHRLDGINNGIPSIIGWPTDTFVNTLKFYREGARTNPVMVSVASSLSDEQMQALAAFFASLPKVEKRGPAPGTRAK
jgi:cytochrome c553